MIGHEPLKIFSEKKNVVTVAWMCKMQDGNQLFKDILYLTMQQDNEPREHSAKTRNRIVCICYY